MDNTQTKAGRIKSKDFEGDFASGPTINCIFRVKKNWHYSR